MCYLLRKEEGEVLVREVMSGAWGCGREGKGGSEYIVGGGK
jgi:hypothetical protein